MHWQKLLNKKIYEIHLLLKIKFNAGYLPFEETFNNFSSLKNKKKYVIRRCMAEIQMNLG